MYLYDKYSQSQTKEITFISVNYTHLRFLDFKKDFPFKKWLFGKVFRSNLLQ